MTGQTSITHNDRTFHSVHWSRFKERKCKTRRATFWRRDITPLQTLIFHCVRGQFRCTMESLFGGRGSLWATWVSAEVGLRVTRRGANPDIRSAKGINMSAKKPHEEVTCVHLYCMNTTHTFSASDQNRRQKHLKRMSVLWHKLTDITWIFLWCILMPDHDGVSWLQISRTNNFLSAAFITYIHLWGLIPEVEQLLPTRLT